jgi:O-antigen ligase
VAFATRVVRPAKLPASSRLGGLWARFGRPEIVPGIMAFAVLASVGVADGGLFPRAWRLATLALVSIAGAALLARRRVGLARGEWLVVGALGAFTGWTALSGLWSGDLGDAVLNAERSLVYPAGMLAALLLVDRASVVHLLGGVLAGATLVCAYGLGIHELTSPPLDPVEGALLFQPLGYANAVGIVATVGILLSLGLALAARRTLARVAALAPLPMLAATLYLTSSRGAMLALAVGVVFLLGVSGRISLRVAAALGGVAAVAAVAVVAASGTPSFAGQYRIQYWQVAWRDYREHPLLGSGAGTFGDYWLRHRPVDVFVRTAHTLYLQALAELGPLGLAVILLAVLAPLAVLRRRRDPVAAAAGAAYLAFALHAGVDWDWELPAVTLAGLFCGAALLASGRDEPPVLGLRARLGLLFPLAAVAVLACVRLKTGGGLPFGP